MYAIPSGQEALLVRLLDPAPLRRAGWRLLGTRIHEWRVAAAYGHRSGRVLRITLAHPSASSPGVRRTEKFALALRPPDHDADAVLLVECVRASLAEGEPEFEWRDLRDPEASSSAERADGSSGRTLRALAPAIRRFLGARQTGDHGEVTAALRGLVEGASHAECGGTAAQMCAVALTSAHLHASALAALEAGLVDSSGPVVKSVLERSVRLAEQLGWNEEALAALRRLVALAPGDSEVLAMAARFYLDRNDAEAAVPHAEAAADLDGAHHCLAGRALAEAGRPEEAVRRAARAITAEASSGELLRAADVFLRAGDLESEQRCLEAALERDPTRHALLRLAERSLWRGDYAGANDRAERALADVAGDATALRCRGMARLMSGDVPSARADLDRAYALDPDCVEILIARAQLLAAEGQHDAALTILSQVQARTGANLGPLDLLGASIRISRGEHGGTAAAFVADFVDKLPVSRATLDRLGFTVSADDERPRAVIDRWMALLHGNRTGKLTAYVPGRGFATVSDRESARVASILLQHMLQTRSVEEVLSRFEAVVAAFPDKPYPRCYRGELFIWLGRYEDARRDLLEALEIRADTRWAHVGLGAVELFSGRPDEAIAAFERGIERARGAGPTTFAYRGEAFRLAGDLPRASSDLRKTCAEWPNRVGSWINLAQVHGAMGDVGGQADIYRRLFDLAPGLMADACAECGIDWPMTSDREQQSAVLERARVMMRGNRSSTLGTWFTAKGDLRARIWGQPNTGADDLEWLEKVSELTG